MKKIFVAFMCIFACFLQACSTKYAQISYSRPDIETDVSAVFVFPTTTHDGEVNTATQLVGASIYSKWSSIYGKKAIPTGPDIEQLLKQKNIREAYMKVVSTLDNVSVLEQTLRNENVKKFLNLLIEELKIGKDSRIALSIMFRTEKGYDKGEPVYVNIGLFDVNNLTWKLITKTESKKGTITTFKVDYNGIVNQHFSSIKKNVEPIKSEK